MAGASGASRGLPSSRTCWRCGSWASCCSLFALALIFAAPIIGQIPLGLAVCLVGLGLVERDGYVVIAGIVVGTLGTSLSLGFLFAVIASAEAIF